MRISAVASRLKGKRVSFQGFESQQRNATQNARKTKSCKTNMCDIQAPPEAAPLSSAVRRVSVVVVMLSFPSEKKNIPLSTSVIVFIVCRSFSCSNRAPAKKNYLASLFKKGGAFHKRVCVCVFVPVVVSLLESK